MGARSQLLESATETISDVARAEQVAARASQQGVPVVMIGPSGHRASLEGPPRASAA
jgi:hypothetical protein